MSRSSWVPSVADSFRKCSRGHFCNLGYGRHNSPKTKSLISNILQGTSMSTLGKGTSSTQKCRLGCEMLVPRRVSKTSTPNLPQGTRHVTCIFQFLLGCLMFSLRIQGVKIQELCPSRLTKPYKFHVVHPWWYAINFMAFHTFHSSRFS